MESNSKRSQHSRCKERKSLKSVSEKHANLTWSGEHLWTQESRSDWHSQTSQHEGSLPNLWYVPKDTCTSRTSEDSCQLQLPSRPSTPNLHRHEGHWTPSSPWEVHTRSDPTVQSKGSITRKPQGTASARGWRWYRSLRRKGHRRIMNGCKGWVNAKPVDMQCTFS